MQYQVGLWTVWEYCRIKITLKAIHSPLMSSIKIYLTVLLFCLNSRSPFAQANTTSSFIGTVINSRGEIYVGRRPIPRVEFKEQEAWSNLEDSVQLRLGKASLKQLFDHSQMRDTTYWTNEELNKCILVQSRLENVDVNDVIRKFHLTDEQQIKNYKRKISQFNATNAQDKDIYNFSKPVFDDSGKFAIIKWDNGHGWLGGGGAIELYQHIGEEWQYLGKIAMWRY
jgi:hypothetical protein